MKPMQPKLTIQCAALLLTTSAPLIADQTWTGTTGDWAVIGNWSGGVAVPTAESAIINNGGTAQIGSAVPAINWLLNNNASSTQVNSGGAIRITGDIDNFGGTLTVNNGGTLNMTGGVLKGGTTIVNSGGTLNFGAADDASWGRVGNGGFGTTSFSIVGGTVNAQFTEGDGLVLGDFEHTTTFNMSSGGILNMAGKGLKVGWWKAGNATLTANASAINFTQDGSVDIGAGGDTVAATGAMILENGASLIKSAAAGGGNFTIGHGDGAKANIGSLTVNTGSTLDWQRGEFIVGNNAGGTGTMTLNGGTVTTHSWTAISRAGANGHLIINGGTMNVVGDTGGYMQVTTADGGTGVVDINGGTLNVTASGGSITYQDWGQAGVSSGTINLNGGRLIAGNIRSGSTSASRQAVFNFNGGILQPNGGNLLHDLGAVNVKAGGAIIDSAGYGGTEVNMPLLDGGGGGGLVIRGNGTDGGDNDRVYLRTDNTYTGGLTIENGAYVNLTGSGDESGVAGTGNITLNGGGFKNWNGSNPTLSRQITLGPSGGYFTIGWGNLQMTLSGKITGSGGLFVNRDGGHLLMTNPANDYSGDTRLGADGPGRYSGGNQAGLYLGADEVIPDGPGKGNLIIDGGYGGHLNLHGFNETVNGLSDINGGRIFNDGAAATLTVGNNNASSTYGGIIENAITLRKIGSGTQTLTSGANTYTGATVVVGGTLVVNGDISTSTLTTVNLGATLSGSGVVGALTVDSGAFLNPGSGPGILTVEGDYSQAGTLNIELNGLSAGTQHDQLNVMGSATLGGLLSATLGYTPANGDLVFILLNDGTEAVSGTFAGLADDSTLNIGGQDWMISYNADSTTTTFNAIGGNDVALMVIPEPKTALLGLFGLLALLRRRRVG